MSLEISLIIFPLCLAYAAVSDLMTMTIPNRVSLILAATFLVLAPFAGLGAEAIAWHMAAAVLVFAGCFALFALGVMGGGDAKLLTATSLWFGFGLPLVSFLVAVAFLGGLLTLAILVMRSAQGQYILSRVPLTHNLTDASKGIPYGIAIAAAGLLSYPDTPLMQAMMPVLAG
jgi:prepilin peptidase CpaA